MKFIILFLLSFFLSEYLHSQNMINDPGFESVYLVDKGSIEKFEYRDWKLLLNIPKYSKNGAPKFSVYSNRKSNDSKYRSFYIPYKGDSYLSSVYTAYRNLYQGKLLFPMKKNKKYRINFYYKICANLIPIKEAEQNINSNLGILFAKNDMSDSASLKQIVNQKTKIPKHISIDNFNYKLNNNKWTYFTTDFESEGDFNYIIIGNFNKLMNESPANPNIDYGICWRFDEINLIEVSDEEYNLEKLHKVENVESSLSSTIENHLDFNSIQKNDSVTQYYNFVDKAEEYIINQQYFKALNEYCFAFKFKIPFWNDYWNAWKIVQDYHIYDSLTMTNLIKGSYKLKNYKNFHIEKLDYLMKKDSSFRIPFVINIRNSFNVDEIVFDQKIDSVLIKKIKFLLERDQNARISRSTDINTADSLNWLELKNIFLKYPEISEMVLGNTMRDYEDICHHLVRYDNKLLLEHLYVQTMKGYFNNRKFANLVDYYCTYNIGSKIDNQYYLSNIALVLNTKYVIPKIDKSLLEKSNINRGNIYLEDVVSQQKKQLYYFRNFDDGFFMYLFDSYADEGSMDKLKQKDDKYLKEFEKSNDQNLIMFKDKNNYDINIRK